MKVERGDNMNNNKIINKTVKQTIELMGRQKLLNEEDACVFIYFLSRIIFEKVLKNQNTKYILSEMLKDNVDLDDMDDYEKSSYTS